MSTLYAYDGFESWCMPICLTPATCLIHCHVSMLQPHTLWTAREASHHAQRHADVTFRHRHTSSSCRLTCCVVWRAVATCSDFVKRRALITNSRHDEHRQWTRRSSPSATNDTIRDEHYTVRDERWVFVERTSGSSRTEADATVTDGRQYQACLSRAPYFVVRCVSLARTLSSPSMSCQCACPNMSGAVDA